MSDTKNQIIKLARRLLQIENEFIELIKEKEIKCLGKIIEVDGEKRVGLDELGAKLFILGLEAFNLTRMIKTVMVLTESLDIEDEEVKSVLTQLKDKTWLNSSFYYVASINKHSEQLGIGPVGKRLIETAYKPDMDFFDDYTKTKFDELYGFDSYISSKFNFPPLITSSSIPPVALKYFRELRELSVQTKYLRTISFYSLCRSIIEICLRDKLRSRITSNRITGKKYVNIEVIRERFDILNDDRLHILINKAKDLKILNKKYCDLAHKIRMEANKIVHPKYNLQDISTDNAIKILKDTVEIIEYLYN